MLKFRGGITLAVIALAFSALFWAPLPAKAGSASLIVSPGSVKTTVGKTFTININLRSDQSVNAASGAVYYPNDLLQATSVSLGGSVFQFWTESPAIQNGVIPFGGGLASPGFTGTGKLFSITFKAKAVGTNGITIGSGKALANDGSGTNIYSGPVNGAFTISPAVSTPSAISIRSSTHTDQSKWYQATKLVLEWDKPSGTSSYTYSLAKVNDASSTRSGQTSGTTVSFENLAEGVWTFTLKDNNNQTGTFQAQIDTTAPLAFMVKSEASTSLYSRSPKFSFEASDDLSGIDHYELLWNEQTNPTIQTEPTYQTKDLLTGPHRLKVKAVDRAGNATEAELEIVIKELPPPVITSAPSFSGLLQPITLRGKALYGAELRLLIDEKEVAVFAVRDYLTEKQRRETELSNLKEGSEVEWTYVYRGLLQPGERQLSAQQFFDAGSESPPSATITIKIIASTINLFGFTIPFYPIAGLLILLATAVILLVLKLRRYHKDLKNLHHQADAELDSLRQRLDAEIDQAAPGSPLRQQVDIELANTKQRIDGTITPPSSAPPTPSPATPTQTPIPQTPAPPAPPLSPSPAPIQSEPQVNSPTDTVIITPQEVEIVEERLEGATDTAAKGSGIL